MARDSGGSTGNYLSVGDVAAIDITGTALTLSVWVNPDVAAEDAGILGKSDGGGSTQYFMRFLVTTGKFRFAPNAIEVCDSGSAVPMGAWSHLAAVKDGTGSSAARVYLDGTVDATASSPNVMPNTSHSLLLGTLATGFNPMDGRIAEVGIWSVALTDREIRALGRGAAPPLVRPQSLAGYWPLKGNASPEPDLRNGNGATIVGTFAKHDSHPRILVPRPAIYLP